METLELSMVNQGPLDHQDRLDTAASSHITATPQRTSWTSLEDTAPFLGHKAFQG